MTRNLALSAAFLLTVAFSYEWGYQSQPVQKERRFYIVRHVSLTTGEDLFTTTTATLPDPAVSVPVFSPRFERLCRAAHLRPREVYEMGVTGSRLMAEHDGGKVGL